MSVDVDFALRRNPLTHTSDYPKSYYAATANVNANYPILKGQMNADVCVIGGGFSGVNAALELRQAGLSVTLLEARKIAWGASGRNGGQLLRGIGQNNDKFLKTIQQKGIDTLEDMGDEAVEIVLARIKKYAIACDLKMGATSLATKKRHIRTLEETAEHLKKRRYRYQISLVLQDNIQQVVGSKHYLAALTLAGDAHLHPLNLCLGEAKAAADLGVKLYERSPVQAIKEGKKITIKTPTGSVKSDFAVICCNAYVSDVHPQLSAKVLPAGSYIIATEPLSKEKAREILPLDTAVVDMNYALDYYRLSADNRLLFGGLCNYSGVDPKSILSALQPKMIKLFPQLASARIDYQWGGLIAIGINRLPQIGRINANIYYAQGYAGHGVNASHIAARIIAESISQQSSRIDLFEKIKHHTLPGSPSLQSALFALGMLYFRLKDKL